MGRKCLCCTHKNREALDRDILANKHSAGAIGSRYSVTKRSVLNHRRDHMTEVLESKESAGTAELKEMLKRGDRLITLLERHLKLKPRMAVSLDWIRESRDLRGWMTYRSKHIGKIAPVGDALTGKGGDTYCVQFITPEGQQARIPLSVYRSLPAFKNGAEGAETGHLQDTEAVSASIHAGLEGK